MRLPRPGPRARRWLRLGFTLLVLALGVLGASRMQLRSAVLKLRQASPLFLALAGALNFPIIFLQAVRWWVLLGRDRISPMRLFRYLLASHTFNSWLPARAGDLLRVYLPTRRDGLAAVTVISTLLIERLFDVLGIIAVGTPLFFIPGVPPQLRVGLLAMLELALLGLAVVSWVARKHGRQGPLADFRRAATAVRRSRGLAAVAGLTLVYWGMELLLVEVSLASVEVTGGFRASALVLFAVNLGSAVQITPGNFVTFEAAAVAALATCGITGPEALAAAVVYHLVQVLPVTLAGLDGLRLVGRAREPQHEG